MDVLAEAEDALMKIRPLADRGRLRDHPACSSATTAACSWSGSGTTTLAEAIGHRADVQQTNISV